MTIPTKDKLHIDYYWVQVLLEAEKEIIELIKERVENNKIIDKLLESCSSNSAVLPYRVHANNIERKLSGMEVISDELKSYINSSILRVSESESKSTQ